MTEKQILEFTEKSGAGYDATRQMKNWKGYEVFNVWWKDYAKGLFGYPVYVLVKGDEIRYATPSESYEITRGRPFPEKTMK